MPIPPSERVEPKLLLCGQTPKPLHGVVPREILGKTWWDKTRKAAYASFNYRCKACGVKKYEAKFHKWLEGHEVYDMDYPKGRMRYIKTVPLCHACHAYIHFGRLQMLLRQGKISQGKFVAIVQHGDKVLRDASLSLPRELEPYNGDFAPWSSWRLILNGKLYPPKFKTYSQWDAAFS